MARPTSNCQMAFTNSLKSYQLKLLQLHIYGLPLNRLLFEGQTFYQRSNEIIRIYVFMRGYTYYVSAHISMLR